MDGDGPPLLLLHGFTGNTAVMWPLGRRLTGVRRVAAVDLPGHGRTGVSEDPHLFGFEHTVDAVARLMDRLDHVPVDVVGYSMGGRIALGLAVRHPHHVASLSLIGASAGLSDAAERSARHHSDDDLADDLLEQGLEWFIDRWMASPLFASQVRLGTDALAAARAQRLENDPEGPAGCRSGQPAVLLARPGWNRRPDPAGGRRRGSQVPGHSHADGGGPPALDHLRRARSRTRRTPREPGPDLDRDPRVPGPAGRGAEVRPVRTTRNRASTR